MDPNDCQYDLIELPSDVAQMIWSGNEPIPLIGDAVRLKINQLGTGVVSSFFREHGHLGVCVTLDDPPAWKLTQHKGTPHERTALVFGREITLIR